MAQENEYRRYDRSAVELVVTLTLADGRLLRGTTGSVGMGGFSVEVDAPPPAGTAVEAELRFGDGPGAVVIRSGGQVVWTRPGWAGVAFVEPDADNAKKLRDLFLYNPMASSAWD